MRDVHLYMTRLEQMTWILWSTYLVEHGVDFNVKNNDGKTALNVAEDNNWLEIMLYLEDQTVQLDDSIDSEWRL